MRTGTGIFLITTGAVLLFALRVSSPHWLNLHVVGVIFILAGATGLLLPRLARTRSRPDWLRRWVQPKASGGAFAADADSNGGQPAPAAEASPPTMVDDLLQFEHPLL